MHLSGQCPRSYALPTIERPPVSGGERPDLADIASWAMSRKAVVQVRFEVRFERPPRTLVPVCKAVAGHFTWKAAQISRLVDGPQ